MKNKITRRQFLKTSALGMAGLALSPHGIITSRSASRRPPNLLFIQSDQWSIRAISSNGCKYVHTPNIDRLASQGVSFDLSFSANPVCCPARSAWYTGRTSSETGVIENGLDIVKDMPDMGQWFGARGYNPFYVGKWHVPGRDVDGSFHTFLSSNASGQHEDSSVSRAAQTFLSTYRDNKPFFFSVGFLQPHDICYWPWFYQQNSPLPTPALTDQLPPLPPNFDFDPNEPALFTQKWRKGGDWYLKEGAPWEFLLKWSKEQWRHYIYNYYRNVEMVDAEIGRVLEALDDSVLAKNTVVIFSSDHGDGMACHKTVQKGFLYEEALRVPFIASCPGRIPQGVKDNSHLVSGLDLAPTLCDYAGIDTMPKPRGRSLRQLLEQRPAEWRDFVVSESNITGRMVRTNDYKLITYKNDPIEQLFDMKNDPWETKNLIRQPKYADVVYSLKKGLNIWEEELEPAR